VKGLVDDDHLQSLGMLASALAGRPLAVTAGVAGEPSWTDGQTVYVDPSAQPRATLEAVAVHVSMLAAGSLAPNIVDRLIRHPKLSRRYLAVEAHRALVANDDLLPAMLTALADRELAALSCSAADSLTIAAGKTVAAEPPLNFGVIRAKKLVAVMNRAAVEEAKLGHVARKEAKGELHELADDAVDDSDEPDVFTSPVGGGGFIGKLLKKLLSSSRKLGKGGGPPGADTPTHRTNSAKRGAFAVLSTASTAEHSSDVKQDGMKYPEWDATRGAYRPDWCTVQEVEPEIKPAAAEVIESASGVRRPLARLGMGLQRQRRQYQGDDIDIDAAVETRVELFARSVPSDAVYLDSLRRRRELSVLVLLDISGSAAEPGTLGRTVHQQQRTSAANLVVALHDLGDRVSLYGYYSQGRAAVRLVPVKRFEDHLDAAVFKRLNSLEPGAYSRLGAAIRHGSSVLDQRGGTPRRLLVVLSDGLAYDHGYEPAYGAADARHALDEARRRGIGCVCLTVGAATDTGSLRKIFGSTAHAAVGRPEQLPDVIGPLFRSAVRSAEMQRRAC
jgi:hypothetical protein